jgi:hypothetical protein
MEFHLFLHETVHYFRDELIFFFNSKVCGLGSKIFPRPFHFTTIKAVEDSDSFSTFLQSAFLILVEAHGYVFHFLLSYFFYLKTYSSPNFLRYWYLQFYSFKSMIVTNCSLFFWPFNLCAKSHYKFRAVKSLEKN